MPELYRKLLQMEQETELLREVNRALREENVLLKDKLKKWDTGHHESQCSSQTSQYLMLLLQFSLTSTALGHRLCRKLIYIPLTFSPLTKGISLPFPMTINSR